MDNTFFQTRATADLGGKFAAKDLKTLVQNAQAQIQNGTGNGIDGLLAAILATQARCNGSYRIYPFFVSSGNQLQVLTNNDERVGLIISISTVNTTPIAGVLLDQGPLAESAVNSSTISRCIQIDTSVQTVMQFNVAPSNFLTMVACNGIDVQGVVFEAY